MSHPAHSKQVIEISEKLIELGRLALVFGRVDRQTFHEDQVTRESDTDHTVMLSLCACSLAQKYYPNLSTGKIAEFCIIHDLVEAYTGDVPTFGMDPGNRVDKEHAEHIALQKVEQQYGAVFPWVHTTISSYERLDTPEARFVKLVDKLMPKITQYLSCSVQFRLENLTAADAEAVHIKQLDFYRDTFGSEFPDIIQLLELLMIKARESLS